MKREEKSGDSGMREALRLAGKLTVLATLVFLCFSGYLAVFAGPGTDTWYGRFTSSSRPSLILGTSRAAKGILPSVFNDSSLLFARPLYNYAFTNDSSPFGEIYTRAIERKLSPKPGQPSLFLIEVTPLALVVRPEEETTAGGELRETGFYFGQMLFTGIDPNVEYILRYYPKPFFRIAIDSLRRRRAEDGPWSEIRNDGWLETFIEYDPDKFKARMSERLPTYGDLMPVKELSPRRVASLESLIEFCRGYGEVFLVRMPLAKPFCEVEEARIPGFTPAIQRISAEYNVPYFDYSSQSENFITVDGTHLHKDSAVAVSRMLLSDIEQAMRSTSGVRKPARAGRNLLPERD